MKEFYAPGEPERYSWWERYSIDRLLQPDFSSERYKEKYSGRPPRLFEVIQTVRVKGHTVIKAQEIGKERESTFIVKERSQSVQDGDLFSVNGKVLSVFTKRTHQTLARPFKRVKGLMHLFDILRHVNDVVSLELF